MTNRPEAGAPERAALLAGRYELVRRLGAGAYGIIHEAYDRELGSRVALKELSSLDADALYAFKNEFRALADIRHPNLVALHELFSVGERWYLTMDLVDGVDFLAYVRGPTGVDVERLELALRQLASGVLALHAEDKLHRDLKPSNVLVSHDGRVFVLDFGLVANSSMAEQERRGESGIVGTPAYLSPEVLLGEPASAAADWYAVGVMMYEALVGRVPFAGSFRQALLQKLQNEPTDPREIDPGLPDGPCDLCMRVLRRDPAARPSDAEMATELGILPEQHTTYSTRFPRVTEAGFIGRHPHREALDAAFAAAARGGTVVVHVHGPSGMGKTALVSAFLEGLERDGAAVVLRGRCFERESVPYRALDSLVDSLMRYLGALPHADALQRMPRDVDALARLFPVLRSVQAVTAAPRRRGEPHEVRRRAFAALRELLARIGDRQPLVLHIDDLQWGDLDSAALLEEILRPPDAPALLLVASYRTEERDRSDLLRALFDRRGALAACDVREIAVGPLEPDEARALAESCLAREGVGTREDVDSIVRESGGSPYFVLELVQHVRASKDVLHAGPITLGKMLTERIGRLPDEARRLLEAIAVAGRPMNLGVVKQAASLDGDRANDAVAVLCAEHLVRTQGARPAITLETFHDRVRESIERTLPEETAKESHLRLAVALEASGGADPEALARHFAIAGETARACNYAQRAAERAADALAFDRAAAHYQSALELAPDPRTARELRVKLADALANAGRGPKAAKEYLAASPGATQAEALDLQRRAAEQLLQSGHMDEGRAVLRAVLGHVGMSLAETPAGALRALRLRRLQLRLRGLRFVERSAAEIDPAELTRLEVCWAAAVGLAGVDVVRAGGYMARYLHLALAAGEPYHVARGFVLESMWLACETGPGAARARELRDKADALAQRLGHPHARGMVGMATGYIAYADGDWEKCTRAFEGAIAIFREHCVGTAWEIAFSEIFALTGLWFRGELADLAQRAQTWTADARERGDLYAATSFRTRFTPKVMLAAGAPDEALREAREAIGEWAQSGWHVQHCFARLAEAEVHLYSGNAEEAWRCATDTWSSLESSLLVRAATMVNIGRLVHALSALAAAKARGDDMLRIAEEDALSFERQGAPVTCAWAQLLRAGVRVQRGDRRGAAALFEAAERGLEASGMRLYAAAARLRRGEILGGDEGRALAEDALAFMRARTVADPERMARILAPAST